MAAQIPLLEGTANAGGYLVPDADKGIFFSRGVDNESAVSTMPGLNIRPLTGKREKYTEFVGDIDVSTVAEGAAKPAVGVEYAQVTLDVVKAAATVIYTEELIEDAIEDPTILVNDNVRKGFARYIDRNALGRNAAGTIVGAFNSELSETTSTVELGTSGDALAVAVSSAMATIEGNGYNPTGIILANDGRAHLRNARGPGDNAATPLYAPGFVQPTDSLYSLPIQYTTNLQTFAGTAAAGRVVGVVGDFSQAILGVRKDVTVSFSNQATIDVGGTLHHLFQQNKVAALWEARLGFVAHDLNRAFVAIINAA